MKKYNYKYLIGFILGMLLLGGSAYAAIKYSANEFYYDKTGSTLNSTNVQGAIDELANKYALVSTCSSTKMCFPWKHTLAVGDYVSYTPVKTNYTLSSDYTGYASAQSINPSELNLWRVLSINSDGTVDLISEYTSDNVVYFRGLIGFQNFAGYLNVLASQYETPGITVGSRHFGYNGQTEFITDTQYLTTNSAPWTCSTGGTCNPDPDDYEAYGGGDSLYISDYELVNTALGTSVANRVGTTTTSLYWATSRTYYYSNNITFRFGIRYVGTTGYVSNQEIYNYGNGFSSSAYGNRLRPIVTLQANLTYEGVGIKEYPMEIIPQNLPSFITDNAVMDNVSSTYVSYSTGIDFSDTSRINYVNKLNGKGIYIRAGTENNPYPIYYYRGEVTDNNVLFGGFCWKIVRTTETGGVKMIYNGTPVTGECTNTTGNNTQLSSTSAFNANDASPAGVGYMYGTRYIASQRETKNLKTSYMYGNGVTWNGSSYSLTDTINSTGSWSTDYNTLNNNHYTCFNTTGTCTDVYYIYHTAKYTGAFYLTLTGGKSIEEALDEMVTSPTDTTSSTIKTAIDTWYSTNLASYASYIEDTIWCNDREIYQLNGLNPNGGDNTTSLYFNPYSRANVNHTPSVVCNRKRDSFTVSNKIGNGKLTYPVGLLTADEMMLAGAAYSITNMTFYLYTNKAYWTMSPGSISTGGDAIQIAASGYISDYDVESTYGVRPTISLKPGGTWSGSGTASIPYQVSYN